MKSFLQELKTRHVIKVAIAYLIAAWIILQLADVIFPALGLPDWSITLVLALLALGFPAALILSWLFDLTSKGIQRTDSVGEDAETKQEPQPSLAADKSIAVLPFTDISAEQDQAYFCDGLTEELLNVFTSIPNLRVASRTSCFAFKGGSIDLPSAAARLQVANILEGSVRKAGNKVRVTAQLIETVTDSHLWSETYDRELDDIFAIQDDIAARILQVLRLQLGSTTLPGPTTHNAVAYEFFLRGRGYAMTRLERDNQRAIEMFQKATAADPGFLRAWSDLAEVYSDKANFIAGGKQAELAAMEASEKALQIDPNHPRSHLACGYAFLACHSYAEAQQAFLKVTELAPEKYDAYYHLGRLAQLRGDIKQSISYFEKAMELNPDDYESPLMAVGSYQEAGDMVNMRHYAQLGIDRARRHMEDYPDNPRPYYLGTTAFLVLDNPKSAQEWADAAFVISPDDSTTRFNLACYYAIKGEKDRALDLLEGSIQSRSWIENDPELHSLREHPRYQALIESLPE